MANERYSHLEISRLVPAPARRKGGGGGPAVRKHADVRRHGNALERELSDAAEAAAAAKPRDFDPGLVIKLRIQAGTLGEDALRSFGIDVISEESDETLVVFINEAARDEFLRRLERYRLGEGGRGVSANVFHAIAGLSLWTRTDRLGPTIRGMEWTPRQQIVLDIELWPRDSRDQNHRARNQTEGWLIQSQAEVWDSIATTSVVLIRARVSGAVLDRLLELETVRIVDLPPVLTLETSALEVATGDLRIDAPPENAIAVAVLDSGVVAGHPLIRGALAEATSYIAGVDEIDETGHGTAVCGFALYGDVEDCVQERSFQTELRLLSGKVLSGAADEYDRKLIEHQVIEAVDYFGTQLGCRVFNISFADRSRPYDGLHVRGLASVLDELARERSVLFVVSAGNFDGSPALPRNWRAEYPHYLFSDGARIIDPAPALNVLTVGSIARYDQGVHAARYVRDPQYQPVARVNQLSPFTRTGPGPNGAIKPDLVEYGGNVAVTLLHGDQPRFQPPDPGLSELALKHTFAGNRLFTPVIGTSFAAPKVTNLAGKLLFRYPDASANLLRALILLDASWPEGATESLRRRGADEEELAFHSFGYGRPDAERTLFSSENCVTLIAEETIAPDMAQFFEIPLPDDFLDPGRSRREIRVSLAHCPPCRSTRRSYKGSKISFKVVVEDSLEVLARRFTAGSDLENISEWRGFTPGSRLRSKGTAMAAKTTIKTMSRSSQLLNGKRLFIVVTHQVEGWAQESVQDTEPYALAVAIEDYERDTVRLYSQLRARLRQRGRARV